MLQTSASAVLLQRITQSVLLINIEHTYIDTDDGYIFGTSMELPTAASFVSDYINMKPWFDFIVHPNNNV